MHKNQKFLSLVTCAAMLISLFTLFTGVKTVSAAQVNADYPAQLATIDINGFYLNISGYTDNSKVIASAENGKQNENWRFDYVGKNSNGAYYKITNMGCGRQITPLGYEVKDSNSVVTYGSEPNPAQHWYITAVDKDVLGYGLHYKITNYSDPSLALTYDSNGIKLAKYTGNASQKWLIKSAGIQGFGGYCKDMNGKEKASVTGGMLGETVQATTFDELKKYCSDDTPRTIVITKNISGKTSGYVKTKGWDGNYRYICHDDFIYIFPNKTIIGSYGANTVYNVFFRTYEGDAWGNGNNIVLKNINVTHDKELNYDNTWEFSKGKNFWLDHISFKGHEKISGSSLGSPDFDKFINFKGDTSFISISDCNLGLSEYGILLGYPTDTEEIYQKYNGAPLVTLADNYYTACLTRAPGLMRYGYFHTLNNYVKNFDMGYTIHSAAKVFGDHNYFEAGTGKGAIVNDDYMSNGQSLSEAHARAYYSDTGSVAVNCYNNNNLKNIKSYPCTWRPSSNYTYKAKTAQDAKDYCIKYSGVQTKKENFNYATFAKAGMPSANYVEKPDPLAVTTTKPATTSTTTVTTTTKPEVINILGDVNKDGKFNISDVVLVQKWILGVNGTKFADPAAADFNKDKKINAKDLTLMKAALLNGKTEPPKPVVTTTTVFSPVITSATTTAKAALEPADFKFSGNVFLVGDSTVADYDANTMKTLDRSGWGTKFADNFNNVKVTNLALAGRSSRSFLTEKNYQTLKNSLGKGDYLFIQFGHNDEKTDEAKYPGLGTYPGLDWATLDNTGKDSCGIYSYEYLLTAYYINLAKNKGAVPVLVTPITRRSLDGKPNYQAHVPYQEGMKVLGRNYKVPVIDMTDLTTQLYNNLYKAGGASETAKMHCWTDTAHTQLDNTHLSNAGASKEASMIAGETKKLGLQISKYIK